MPVVAFMFGPSKAVGYSQEEAICTALTRELLTDAHGGKHVAALIRSGGLLLHAFAYRRVEVSEIESVNGLPAFGWLEQVKMQTWRYLLADFLDLTSKSWHQGDVWALNKALQKLHVEVYSVGPVELDTAQQIHRRLTAIDGYIGCVEVDLGHPVVYQTCWSGLGDRFQVVDTEFGFLDPWGTPEEERWPLEVADRWWHTVGASAVYWTSINDESSAHPPSINAAPDSERGAAARSALVRLLWSTPLERLVDEIRPSELPLDTKSFSAEKLPGAEDAVIPPEKLHGYALNLDHPNGGPKARNFRDLLGIVASDWRFLAEQLRRGVLRVPAFRSVSRTNFGVRFDVITVVKGRNGAIKPVLSAWIVRPDEPPTLTTTFIAKRGTGLPAMSVDEVPILLPDRRTDWQLLWEVAVAAATEAGDLTVPEPMCVTAGPDGPGDWFLDGAEGYAKVRVPDARRGFARWLRQSGNGEAGYQPGTYVYAPGRGFDKCVAWANAFAEVLDWHGVDCEVNASMT